MRAELIIFDLDGTLVDSSKDIAWAANRTLEAYGRKTLDLESIREHIGWGVKSLLERLMPDMAPDGITEARSKFLDFYSRHIAVWTEAYPGVEETLEHFRSKGKRLAIVTNKPEGLAEDLLAELGLDTIFEMVVGGDSFPNRKPHPEPLERVLDALGVEPEAAVFVGDSPVDCEAGRAAGLTTIGVTYGFRPRTELDAVGFNYMIDRFTRLKGLID